MSRNKEKKEKKKRGGFVNFLLTLGIIVCLGVFAFSAYKLISIYLEYKAGTDEYDRLHQYAVEQEVPKDDDIAQPQYVLNEAGEEVVLDRYPPEVDFASLKAINPDVIGWLDVEALNISYPIVQGADNDYYLHRTTERQYNFAGSIFMDYENNKNFTDPNTIIYGHNMKNQSMFGTLKFIKEQEKYKDSIYFWIVTPEKRIRYQIFSAFVAQTAGDAYTLFSGPDQMVVDFGNKMVQNSEIPVPQVTFKPESNIVTLSTCSFNDSVRFVVMGIKEGEY